MRWPFTWRRRRADGGERETGRAWRRLRALDTTVDVVPPILSGPALRMPPVAGTKPVPVLRRPELPRRELNVLPLGGSLGGLVGRVSGLVRPRSSPELPLRRRRRRAAWKQHAEVPVVHEVEDFQFEDLPSVPARIAPVVTPVAVTTRPVLTRAVDDYVGEPIAPAPPPRPVTPVAAPMSDDPFFAAISQFMPNRRQTATAPAPQEKEQTRPQHLAQGPPRPRANLGQSRRLGLGHAVAPRKGRQEPADSQATPRHDEPDDAKGDQAPDVTVTQPHAPASEPPVELRTNAADREVTAAWSELPADSEVDDMGAHKPMPRPVVSMTHRRAPRPATPPHDEPDDAVGPDDLEPPVASASPAAAEDVPEKAAATGAVATTPEAPAATGTVVSSPTPSGTAEPSLVSDGPAATPTPPVPPGVHARPAPPAEQEHLPEVVEGGAQRQEGAGRTRPKLGLGAPLRHRRPVTPPAREAGDADVRAWPQEPPITAVSSAHPETGLASPENAVRPVPVDSPQAPAPSQPMPEWSVPSERSAPDLPSPDLPLPDLPSGDVIARWLHPAFRDSERTEQSTDIAALLAARTKDVGQSEINETRSVTPDEPLLRHRPVSAIGGSPVANAQPAAEEPSESRKPLRHRLISALRRRQRTEEAPVRVVGAPPAPAPRPQVAPTPQQDGRRRLEPVARTSSPDSLTRHAVPGAVASAFRRLHGTDVSAVPVLRGPLAGRFARALGARALTHQGAVFLPDEAGPLESAGASSLLAHELVHHVQQAERTTAVDESTSDGQRMEQVAVATERWFRGDRAPMAHVRLPIGRLAQTEQSSMPENLDTYVHNLVEQAADKVHHQVLADTQRAPAGTSEAGLATTTSASPGNAQGNGAAVDATGGVGLSESALASLRRGEPVVVRPAAQGLPGVVETLAEIQRAADAPRDVRLMSEETERELRESLRHLRETERAFVRMTDGRQLDELARRLYERIRAILRNELLVDRERSGLLADFR